MKDWDVTNNLFEDYIEEQDWMTWCLGVAIDFCTAVGIFAFIMLACGYFWGYYG